MQCARGRATVVRTGVFPEVASPGFAPLKRSKDCKGSVEPFARCSPFRKDPMPVCLDTGRAPTIVTRPDKTCAPTHISSLSVVVPMTPSYVPYSRSKMMLARTQTISRQSGKVESGSEPMDGLMSGVQATPSGCVPDCVSANFFAIFRAPRRSTVNSVPSGPKFAPAMISNTRGQCVRRGSVRIAVGTIMEQVSTGTVHPCIRHLHVFLLSPRP